MSASAMTISFLPSPSMSTTTVRTHFPKGPTRPNGMFRVRDPLAPLAIFVLEPRVRANHIKVAIAVEIGHAAWRDRAVHSGGRCHAVPRIAADQPGILNQQSAFNVGALVAHHHDVRPPIAVDVGDKNVVRAGGVGRKDESLEGFARLACPYFDTRRRCRPDRSSRPRPHRAAPGRRRTR